MQLAAIILAGGKDPGTTELAGHGGVAYALSGLLTALPVHASRRQCYLPADLIAAHGVDLAAAFAGRMTPELGALLSEMRAIVRRHLETARGLAKEIDRAMMPAFLPLALVEPRLRLLEKPGFDPLRRSASLMPWRRHWLIWRAARRGL